MEARIRRAGAVRDVSGKNFKIIVRYGSSKKPTFKGDLDEFAAWIDKD